MILITRQRIQHQQQYERLSLVLILLALVPFLHLQQQLLLFFYQLSILDEHAAYTKFHSVVDCSTGSRLYYVEAFVIITTKHLHLHQNRHGHYHSNSNNQQNQQQQRQRQRYKHRLLPNDILDVKESTTALGIDIDTCTGIVTTDNIDKTLITGMYNSNSNININNSKRNSNSNNGGGAITMTIDELSTVMGSSKRGRAQLVWDCYRLGIDPALFYSSLLKATTTTTTTTTTTSNTLLIKEQQQQQVNDEEQQKQKDQEENELITNNNNNNNNIRKLLPSSRRKLSLGIDALYNLASTYFPNHYCIENDIVTLIDSKQQDSMSSTLNTNTNTTIDLTTKLIIQLYDKLQIETVIIPSYKYNRTTICISSQVGCIQQCQFCATGTMGKFRSLSSNEILGQFFLSQQYIRQFNFNNSVLKSNTTNHYYLPPISNVVFMGMGEPADNIINVQNAVRILTSNNGYQLSSTRVTVSTVAPTPQSFQQLFVFNSTTGSTSTDTTSNNENTNTNTNCMIAWSVHSVNDTIRKLLVPTTKYTMIELRQGLINVLNTKPIQFRTIMIEIVLISNLNDNIIDATQLALFCQVILQQVQHCKLIVNLIPYNEIIIPNNELNVDIRNKKQPAYMNYKKPTMERVYAFQKELLSNNIYTHIRTPRGDTEAAACGQLVTNNKNKNKKTTTNNKSNNQQQQQQQQKITVE